MNALLTYVFTEARKAVVAFGTATIGTGFGAFQIAIQDGTVTQVEWEQIIGSALVVGVIAAIGVFRTANKPAPVVPASPPTP